jgi:hypothetical protein
MTLMQTPVVMAPAGVLCVYAMLLGQAYRVGNQLSQNTSLTALLFPARRAFQAVYTYQTSVTQQDDTRCK